MHFSIFVFCLILKASKSGTGWIFDFVQYIRTDAGVYQVVFLVNANTEQDAHSRIDFIMQKITQTFPSVKMGSNEVEIKKTRELIQTPSFFNPQTSLFVTIQSQYDDQKLMKLQDFLTELCQNRKRPRYLMIFFQEKKNQNYEKLLRQLWSKQFVDATVLQLMQSSDRKNESSLDLDQKIVTLHYFNPFTKIVTSRDYSRKVHWFPDKLRDMRGYQMNISFLHRPPDIFVKRNQTSFQVSGMMNLKINALAKAMNFRIWIAKNLTTYGKFSCSKHGNTDVYHGLRNNELQINAEEFVRFGACDDRLYEYSKAIGERQICLVVPILPDEALLLTKTWEIWHGIVVASIPFIIWITPRLLHFESRNWRLAYIVQMLLGFGIPREPHHHAERIFFAGILWAYFLYSSILYTLLTSMIVQQKVPIKYQDIEDIIASDLEPIIEEKYYSLMYNTSDDRIRYLLDKATKVNAWSQQCLDRLITHKNVVCIMREHAVRMALRGQKDSCGQPVANIMVIMKNFGSTVLEPGSPFVQRINDLIQRLIQSGVVEKWRNKYYFNEANIPLDTSISCNPEKLEITQIIRQIFFLLCFGYASFILVFLGELIAPVLVKMIG